VGLVDAAGQKIATACEYRNNRLEVVARESYRIRPALAKSINLVLATTLANIRALQTSLAEVNKATEKGFAGFTTTLQTIKGIGPIYAAGIFAEIGDIRRFATDAQLAKYAGLAWRKRQSGNFTAEDTPLMRQSKATGH
jgi:transposase